MAGELPVLIASVGPEQAASLEAASRAGRHVWVELRWPPAQLGPHLLEVYRPDDQQPLRLLAEPLGTSSVRGTALRIYPWEDEDNEDTLMRVNVKPDDMVGRPLAGGRFEILSVLGEGSIGAVYRARHTGLGIDVALKVLHEAFQRDTEFCRRFYAEALALSRLDHPSLVHVYDFGQEPDGLLYLAMTLVDGLTLRAIQSRERRFDVKRVVGFMLQVSAGLGHAHGRGLIHRDVKPDNVMVMAKADDDGNRVENVKVLDFGFAIPPSASADVAQRLAGTPVYMSPEQCLGQELDARSDVYACGVMIYEMLVGSVPFIARSASAIQQMHIDNPPPRIAERRPDIDPRVDELVQKAMAKDRAQRHPSMQELRAELKQLLAPANSTSERGVENLRPSRAPIPSAPSASIPVPREPSLRDAMAAAPTEAQHAGVADALAANAAAWMADLTQTRESDAFARRFGELEGAVRVLAERGDVKTLHAVAAVVVALEQRLGKLAAGGEEAAHAISRVARVFADPEVVSKIAAVLLAQDEARAGATELLARAGVQGAYALYGARTATPATPRSRVVFVNAMKALGESATPVLKAGLERVLGAVSDPTHRSAIELAEDLLLALPATHDELCGQLVARYTMSPAPALCRAAARALARVWGGQAKPVLVGLVTHDDDGVRVAAIVGLREIGWVDLDVVRRIASLFGGGHARSAQLKAASMGALHAARPEAREEAARVLELLGR